jgi:integrase
MQRTFTDPFIRNLKPQEKAYKRAEYAPRGEGRLIVRVLPSGVKEFFYRYRTKGGDKTLALGRYDFAGKNGKTLAEIRKVLREKRDIQESTGDIKEHLRAIERKDQIARRQGSFDQLMTAYVDALKAAKKPSAHTVELVFKRYVRKPFSSLVEAKASEIEPGDIQQILARMVKAGITRQVNVTRTYLRAAFEFGAKADHDPRTVARDGVLFGLKYNPVAVVPRIVEYDRVGERTLSEDELRDFWKALDKLPLIQQATIRFNVAIGCQRIAQLLRADWTAFSFDDETLLLRDSKGRGGSRDHLLPLTAFALEQLQPLRDVNQAADMPFTTDGKRAIVTETLSVAVRDISAALTKEHEYPPFQQRDLRRTCETMLQRLGVDKEVRAHVLSHGRSQGVQGKHYERYDFLTEKRAALEKWAEHLRRIIDPKREGKVIKLRPTVAREPRADYTRSVEAPARARA